jgi:hypothetical protein
MGRGLAAAAALTLVVAVAAGCGSSDDEGTSKADFVKQADAICAKGDKEIDSAGQKEFGGAKQEPSKAAITKFMKETAVPSVRRQVDAIKKLDPPKGDESEVKAITDAADAATAKIEANPILGTEEGPKDPFAKTDKLARAYGLKTCGSS